MHDSDFVIVLDEGFCHQQCVSIASKWRTFAVPRPSFHQFADGGIEGRLGPLPRERAWWVGSCRSHLRQRRSLLRRGLLRGLLLRALLGLLHGLRLGRLGRLLGRLLRCLGHGERESLVLTNNVGSMPAKELRTCMTVSAQFAESFGIIRVMASAESLF